MIRIYIDPYQLRKEGPTAIVVSNVDQYIDSRLKIREAIDQGIDLVVIVRNRKIANWYGSLAECPHSMVTIEHILPRTILAGKLHLPKALSMVFPLGDQDIIDRNLIQRAIDFPPQSPLATSGDVEDWLLSACVHPVYTERSGSLDHLSCLMSWMLSEQEHQTLPAGLVKLIQKREEDWMNSELGELYTLILRDSPGNAFLFYACQIMRLYPQHIRKRIVDELARGRNRVAELASKYVSEMPPIECSDSIESKVELSTLAEVQWKKVCRIAFESTADQGQPLQKAENIVQDAIQSMSGRISGEIHALVALVQQVPQYFTDKLFNLMAAKFNGFPDEIQRLRDLIPPAEPSKPSIEWTWDEMRQWAIDEYFPYKRWSVQHHKSDKLAEQCAKLYGDWLYEHYPKMKNELEPLNYGTWQLIKRHLSGDYQILWIIVDNLCWFFVHDVVEAFKQQGFHLISPGVVARLSMLPSETKTSKRALVAGKLPCQLDSDNYQDLFEQYCTQVGIADRRAMRDRELRNTKLGQERITCCIINKLDVQSHAGFFDYEEDVMDSLKHLAQYLREFVPPEKSFRKFRLIISTDHGSCIIPEDARACVKPKNARLHGEHKRLVYVDSADGLGENWYFLSKRRFGLRESIAIAKGYRFVGKSKPRGLVHGGMTPEETFIPHFEFSLERLQISELRYTHSSSPIPMSTIKHGLEISFLNPNDYDVTDVNLYLPSHSLEVHLDMIGRKDQKAVPIEIALPKETTTITPENTALIEGYYRFDCLGERRSGVTRIEIKIMKILDVSGTPEELLES